MGHAGVEGVAADYLVEVGGADHAGVDESIRREDVSWNLYSISFRERIFTDLGARRRVGSRRNGG